jgi:hypothetical protein
MSTSDSDFRGTRARAVAFICKMPCGATGTGPLVVDGGSHAKDHLHLSDYRSASGHGFGLRFDLVEPGRGADRWQSRSWWRERWLRR